MLTKLHRQDGSEVWVNLALVTHITRARTGTGSELHFSRMLPAGGWATDAPDTVATPLIVREWVEDILKTR